MGAAMVVNIYSSDQATVITNNKSVDGLKELPGIEVPPVWKACTSGGRNKLYKRYKDRVAGFLEPPPLWGVGQSRGRIFHFEKLNRTKLNQTKLNSAMAESGLVWFCLALGLDCVILLPDFVNFFKKSYF